MNINEYINLYFENKIVDVSDIDENDLLKNYKFIGMYHTVIDNKKKYMVWDVINNNYCVGKSFFDNNFLKTKHNNKEMNVLTYLIYRVIYSENIILNIKMELYFILGLYFSFYKTDIIYMIKKNKKKYYFIKI